MKLPKYSNTLIRVTISVLLLGYLSKTQDFSTIFTNLINFNPLLVFCALIFLLLGTLVSALRWQRILLTSQIKVSLSSLFALYLKGYFYNNFLPTQMGGDFYKAASLSNSINNKSVSFFSVFVDRFAGLIVLLLIGLYGVSAKINIYYSLVILVLSLVGFVFYFPVLKVLSKKVKFLNKFYEASLLLVKDIKSGLLILFYSLLVQIFSFSLTYLLFTGFNIYLHISEVLAFMPLISLSLLLPSFNGWGAQETVYAKLFATSGVSASISIAVSLLIQSIRIIMSLIGGLLIATNLGKLKYEDS